MKDSTQPITRFYQPHFVFAMTVLYCLVLLQSTTHGFQIEILPPSSQRAKLRLYRSPRPVQQRTAQHRSQEAWSLFIGRQQPHEEKAPEVPFVATTGTLLSSSTMDSPPAECPTFPIKSVDNFALEDPAMLNHIFMNVVDKRMLFQYVIPIVGVVVGAACSDVLSASLFDSIPTNTAKQVATMLFASGAANALGDTIDDEGLWKSPAEAHVLHKLSRSAVTVFLHFCTFAGAMYTTTWSNPIPFALLSAMYTYAIVIRGKAVPDFDKKPEEAFIILMCLLPLFGLMGAKMATSGLYMETLLSSFAFTTLWLQSTRHEDFWDQHPQLQNTVTEYGVFRVVPLLAVMSTVDTSMRSTLLVGIATFFADQMGYQSMKKVIVPHFGKSLTKYGMVLAGLAWGGAYGLFAWEGIQPFHQVALTYNLSWEAFFTLERIFFSAGKPAYRAVAPAVWFMLDAFMIFRCEGADFLPGGIFTTCFALLSVVLFKLNCTPKVVLDHFKYSSWGVSIFLNFQVGELVQAHPDNTIIHTAALLAAGGNILAGIRSLYRTNNTDEVKYSYFTPLIIACVASSLYQILAISLEWM